MTPTAELVARVNEMRQKQGLPPDPSPTQIAKVAAILAPRKKER